MVENSKSSQVIGQHRVQEMQDVHVDVYEKVRDTVDIVAMVLWDGTSPQPFLCLKVADSGRMERFALVSNDNVPLHDRRRTLMSSRVVLQTAGDGLDGPVDGLQVFSGGQEMPALSLGRMVARDVKPLPVHMVDQDLSDADGRQLWIVSGRLWGADDDTVADVWGDGSEAAVQAFKMQILDADEDQLDSVPEDGPGSVIVVNSFRVGQVMGGRFVLDSLPPMSQAVQEQAPQRQRG